MAKFKALYMIKITGRGLVICGDIEEGSINERDQIVFDDETKFPIQSIGFIDYKDGDGTMKAHIGLSIKVNDSEAEELKKRLSPFMKKEIEINK